MTFPIMGCFEQCDKIPYQSWDSNQLCSSNVSMLYMLIPPVVSDLAYQLNGCIIAVPMFERHLQSGPALLNHICFMSLILSPHTDIVVSHIITKGGQSIIRSTERPQSQNSYYIILLRVLLHRYYPVT